MVACALLGSCLLTLPVAFASSTTPTDPLASAPIPAPPEAATQSQAEPSAAPSTETPEWQGGGLEVRGGPEAVSPEGQGADSEEIEEADSTQEPERSSLSPVLKAKKLKPGPKKRRTAKSPARDAKRRQSNAPVEQSNRAPERDSGAAQKPPGAVPPQPQGKAPGQLSVARRQLKDFRLLEGAAFFAAHNLKEDEALEAAIRQVRTSIVGTYQERLRVNKECEQRFFGDPTFLVEPTADTIGCLFWKLKALQKPESAAEYSRQAQERRERQARQQQLRENIRHLSKVRSPDDWSRLATLTYEQGLGIIDFTERATVDELFQVATKNLSDCATTPARGALIRNYENFLPDPSAWTQMKKLYAAIQPCLTPERDGFEIVHHRMALLSLERGEVADAARSLDAALRAPRLQEEFRSQFWRGYIHALSYTKDGKILRHENPYWQGLVTKYPLTLHALVADAILDVDSTQRIRARPSPFVAQYAGDEWDEFNLSTFVYALMAAKGHQDAMLALSNFMTKHIAPVDFETGLFLGIAHMAAGNTRAGIATVFSVLRDHGTESLNLEVLELLYPLAYRTEITQYAEKVDSAIIFALVRQESSFNPKAASGRGAQGLMQVLPRTAQAVLRRRHVDLFDPKQNITAGSRYLAELIGRYDGNLVLTFAAYNAGPSPIKRWQARYPFAVPLLFSDLIPYSETRNYVATLLRNVHWYRSLLTTTQSREGSADTNQKAGPETIWTARRLAPSPEVFGVSGQGTQD